MGWQGHQREIALGMIFKKMYCQYCGTKLRIKKNTRIVNKGDKGFSTRMPGPRNALGMSSYRLVTYTYMCPKCNSEITYNDQCIVAKKQKRLNKKSISENDLITKE